MQKNISIVNSFFQYYGKKDMNALKTILAEDVKWIFPGHHNLSGTKNGIDEVIAFFDKMGTIMGSSAIKAERLFMEANEHYVVEYQHIWTNRTDGNNLDHHWCVTWKIKNNRITEGRHFAGNQHEVDRFFHKISQNNI
ncbi:MAG: nuclear transport factor 2 family protein [Bacteroidetes bacterium]|nr:nuclear transport factor 2 family protein [Bacteroidota bacterium]